VRTRPSDSNDTRATMGVKLRVGGAESSGFGSKLWIRMAKHRVLRAGSWALTVGSEISCADLLKLRAILHGRFGNVETAGVLPLEGLKCLKWRGIRGRKDTASVVGLERLILAELF
jgi:hypothetical protein